MRGIARVFHCPACGRVIFTSSLRCKYCSSPIDRQAAEAAADREDTLSEASLYATLMHRSMAEADSNKPPNWLLVVAMPVLVIAWLIRYRKLPWSEADAMMSIRSVKQALALWVPLMIGFVLFIYSRMG